MNRLLASSMPHGDMTLWLVIAVSVGFLIICNFIREHTERK